MLLILISNRLIRASAQLDAGGVLKYDVEKAQILWERKHPPTRAQTSTNLNKGRSCRPISDKEGC